MGCGASAEKKYGKLHDTPSPKEDGTSKSSSSSGKTYQYATTAPEPVDESYTAESADYEQVVAFLDKVPVFQTLNKADLPLIAKAMHTTSYKSGEVIIAQGNVSSKLFVILSGQADVVLREDSSDVILVTLAAGDYFGEQELLHEETARASVRAVGDEDLLTYSIAHDKFWQLGLHKKLCVPKRHACVNRQISATDLEGTDTKEEVPAKTEADLIFLAKAFRANAYLPSFCELTDDLVAELAAAARFRTVEVGEVLMKQGDLHGGCLYIVQNGGFEIHGRGRRGGLKELAGNWHLCVSNGSSFGELELLYAVPCAATVTALKRSTLWAISRSDFTVALGHSLTARLIGYAELLRGVKIFKGLYNEELKALAASLTEVNYNCGEDIITQGELVDACFVLVEGEVVVLLDGVEIDRRSAVRAKKKAELFGEEELQRPSPRVATVRVTSESARVLALDKASFERVLEPLDEILCASNKLGSARFSVASVATLNLGVERADLQMLGNLGFGNFGTVELVEEQGTGRRFALKRVPRDKLEESWEQRQILAEKTILSMTDSPFVVHLFGTYRDSKALAFLLELVPGGDLHRASCLYDMIGNAKSTQFYTAGVMLALEHLHERCILHRDIKPDNVLLDGAGWPKVTDFGLAKFCTGMTFTSCGTPGYVAPEVISQIGHGSAVDWWALGILMYEMMDGCTPFESPDGDFLKTCQLSMRGIPSPQGWPWPKCFGPIGAPLTRLISSLLQANPLRRLPMKPDGILQFKAHPWFDETKKRERFDWVRFQDQALEPPIAPAKIVVAQLLPSRLKKDWDTAEPPDTEWDADF